MEYTAVTPVEFSRTDGVADWRYVLGAVRATFAAGSFPAAAAMVAAITDEAERMVHHPDIDVRYPGDVHVAISTHATGGLTTLDIDLARAVSQVASAMGAAPRPQASQATEIAIDTVDDTAIRPFWAAVLGYDEADDGSLFDPRRSGPSVWFQHMDVPRTERNRFHLDISVPHDVADERIAAAVAAGGTLVGDAEARAFWILADAEGNEACVCTWQDRDRQVSR